MNPPELNPKYVYDIKVPEIWSGLLLFTPYDISIEMDDVVSIEIGRFSLSVLARIHAIASRLEGTRLKVGAFCEASMDSCIQVGGEHSNSGLLNFTFGSYCDHFKSFMSASELDLASSRSRSIIVGDNVVLSRGVILANAADVGSGCIIGAGALVVGRCEPLGIYGGVPARRIRDRFDARLGDIYREIRLPDIAAHSVVSLPSKLSSVQSGELSLAAFKASVEYLHVRPRVHLRARLVNGAPMIQEIVAFYLGPQQVTEPSLVAKLRSYFDQGLTKQTSIRWAADIFYTLGLY